MIRRVNFYLYFACLSITTVCRDPPIYAKAFAPPFLAAPPQRFGCGSLPPPSPIKIADVRKTPLPTLAAGSKGKGEHVVEAPTCRLDRSGGVLYRKGIFAPAEYDMIAEEVASLVAFLQTESSSSVAKHRLGVALDPATSPTVQLLQTRTNRLTSLVQQQTAILEGCFSRKKQDAAASVQGTGQLRRGADALRTSERGYIASEQSTLLVSYSLAKHIPVEIRSYEQPGACMAWHVDDVLYDPPQVEVVWTLENTSDCQTVWKITTTNGHKVESNNPAAAAAATPDDRWMQLPEHDETSTTTTSVETDRNSVLLLRAGVTPHCVTSLKRGRRIILKCAYVREGATYLGKSASGGHSESAAAAADQFGSIRKKHHPSKKQKAQKLRGGGRKNSKKSKMRRKQR